MDIINPNSYYNKKFRLNYIFNFFVLKRSYGFFQASYLSGNNEQSPCSISIESLNLLIINAKLINKEIIEKIKLMKVFLKQ